MSRFYTATSYNCVGQVKLPTFPENEELGITQPKHFERCKKSAEEDADAVNEYDGSALFEEGEEFGFYSTEKQEEEFEEKHNHIEDYVKKSVEYVYDMEEVMTALESNADDVDKSDKATKRPDVNQMVKYVVGKEVDIQESIPQMTKDVPEENDDNVKKEIQEFQNPVPMIYKPNLPRPSDLQTKPIGFNYPKFLSQLCRIISEYPRCPQKVKTKEQTIKTPAEALYDEAESKGYAAGIVVNQDSPPEKSVKTEAKIAVPSVFKSLKSSADDKGATDEECATKVDEEERVDTNSGSKMCKFREDCTEKSRANEKKTVVKEKGATDDEYATNEDEEGKDLKSGRNMGKFREDCPEKSNIDEEETKTKPVEEDDSKSSRVRSGLNSRDLKAPVESPGAEVAQIMSKPERSDNQFIQRINEDPPIAKHGRVQSG